MMIYPQQDFARSTPEAQGISSRAIESMLLDIRRSGADIHSMLVMRHGCLVFEQYFAPYEAETPHAMYSCSKTFTSVLIGIAQDKGLLNTRDHVLDFFPDQAPENANENFKAMTIADLLMMGSGHAADTFAPMMASMHDESADWVGMFFAQPAELTPGTRFVYNTGATYMLSAILTKVTGRSAFELAREWLFGDMGIEGAVWESCPRGISIGGAGLHITPRDMLKMGMLLLGRGRWKNKQLVSGEYIMSLQSKHIENRSGDPNQDPNWAAGYGYQVWRNAFGGYRADGMGGQFITVLPKEEMVVVFTSALGDDISIGYPMGLIEKYLLPGTFERAQVYGVDAAASLESLAREMHAPVPQEMPQAAKGFPFGALIELEENPLKLKWLRVTEKGVEVEMSGRQIRGNYAWGAPQCNAELTQVPFNWVDEGIVSVLADWNEDALFLAVRYLGQPLSINMTIGVQGDKALVRARTTLMGGADIAGSVVR